LVPEPGVAPGVPGAEGVAWGGVGEFGPGAFGVGPGVGDGAGDGVLFGGLGVWSISSVPDESALGVAGAGFSASGVSAFGVSLLATAVGSGVSAESGACRLFGLVGSFAAALESESGSGTSEPPPHPIHDKQTPAIARRPIHALIDLMAAILIFRSD
jgi:hypothetical protein